MLATPKEQRTEREVEGIKQRYIDGEISVETMELQLNHIMLDGRVETGNNLDHWCPDCFSPVKLLYPVTSDEWIPSRSDPNKMRLRPGRAAIACLGDGCGWHGVVPDDQ